MGIRKATLADQPAISNLLDQLGYPGTEIFLLQNMTVMLNQPSSAVLVYELDETVAGFIAIDFIPQLATKGDFARISCFAVDAAARSKGIGNILEEYCTQLANDRNCDRMEVHCHSRRVDAHRFYERQGYEESPKYFRKMIAG
ncbi:GNAT family N-acetyltransferase [Mucilaginibacter sp. SP1R1]|uniref:GNAT family N-acetyltransferase n=1 Tax=Mucilaginibacter sp. SP1R1 TaxID=2723091 RepID=UPI00160BAFF0|nr:GNAT family N-acetyltransferase [Mucilaginibacter sp. SP1R1]MBB6150519.1 N-acetylglutamate synthase-like GNAT family acetyltransferase [Mucilaginibacter sp. SP1R1]